jgi:hypothetical protein
VCDAVVGKEHAYMDSAWTLRGLCVDPLAPLFSWTICSLACFCGVIIHPLKMEHIYIDFIPPPIDDAP